MVLASHKGYNNIIYNIYDLNLHMYHYYYICILSIYIYILYQDLPSGYVLEPYRVFLKGLYTFRHPLAEPKNTTGYGDNDVDSTIFGRDGWR